MFWISLANLLFFELPCKCTAIQLSWINIVLKSCISIVISMVLFKWRSMVKTPCWRQDSNPLPANPDYYSFCNHSFLAGFGRAGGPTCCHWRWYKRWKHVANSFSGSSTTSARPHSSQNRPKWYFHFSNRKEPKTFRRRPSQKFVWRPKHSQGTFSTSVFRLQREHLSWWGR